MHSEIYLQKTQKYEIKNIELLFIFSMLFSAIYIFLYENSLKAILIFLGFVFIGSSLKFIDNVFDTNSFDKKFAIFLSFPTGIIMGLLTFFDFYSAMIWFSVVFGVFIAGKIDHIGFKIVFLIFTLFAFLSLLNFNFFSSTIIIAIVVLFFTCILDEKLNEIAENKKINPFLAKFFYYRPAMKISVFGLCFFVFPFFYFFAFLSFDFSYSLVESLGEKNERI